MTEGDFFSYREDLARQEPKALSTKELEDIIRHHSSFSSHDLNPPSPLSRRGESSKAYVSAMKALQEKLHIAEQEIGGLKYKLAQAENKTTGEVKKAQDELKISLEKEHIWKSKLGALEDEARSMLQENIRLKEQLKIKESQIVYSESEVSRYSEQSVIDKQNLALQLEIAEKSLGQKSKEERNAREECERIKKEYALLKEEVSQNKRIIQSLESETKFLRENSESQRHKLQKAYEDLENRCGKQNDEFSQKMKQLQIQNKNLKELTSNQLKQIEHLKKELTEQNRFRNRSQDLTKIRSQDLTKHRTPDITKKKSLPKIIKSPKFAAKIKKTTPKKVCEEDLQASIGQLEREISALNSKYRNLLLKSGEEITDISKLRKEINDITSEIENKSEKLVNLKKRHQNILKSKLSS